MCLDMKRLLLLPPRFILLLLVQTTFTGCAVTNTTSSNRPTGGARRLQVAGDVPHRRPGVRTADVGEPPRNGGHQPGHEPVKLLGGDSYAIDPKGESHPLADRVIPPGNFVKLISPAANAGPRDRPALRTRRRGGRRPRRAPYHHGYPGYGAAGVYDDPGPRYYSIYDPNDAPTGSGKAKPKPKLVLTFERGSEALRTSLCSGGRRCDALTGGMKDRRRW